jgi:signal transduction histidine kinase
MGYKSMAMSDSSNFVPTMQAPGMPGDEELRLHALREYGILDTPPDPSLDHVTRLAAAIMRVPISLVSLIDTDRQWFKSKFGLLADETGRDVSFCGHAILQDEVFVIPDASLDSRFAGNPLVVGDPNIRFYAGAPLRTPDGYRIGTLCVIDTEPREGLTEFEANALEAMAVLVVDEMELRQAERTVATQRNDLKRYYEVMGASTDFMGLATPEGQVIGINPAGRRMAGLSEDQDVSTLTIAALHPPRVHETLFSEALPTAMAEGSWRGKLTLLSIDGLEIPTDQVILSHRNDDGEIVYLSTIARDVSAASEVLRLRDVEIMKDEFVSTVSHELRTPLTSIIASLGLLADGAIAPLDPAVQEVVDIALINSERLVHLVDDILDYERMEVSTIELKPAFVSAAGMVDSAIMAVIGTARERNVELIADPEVDGDFEIECDPHRVIQVLINLLGNAVKFSPHSSSVIARVDRSADGSASFAIIDHGHGIDKEMLPKLFDPFWQVDSSASRAVGGSGLGLAISRRIVEQHGGTIEVNSERGVGSTFRVVLPLRQT